MISNDRGNRYDAASQCLAQQVDISVDVLVLAGERTAGAARGGVVPESAKQARAAYWRLPLTFVPNAGQLGRRVLAVAVGEESAATIEEPSLTTRVIPGRTSAVPGSDRSRGRR